MQQAIISNSKIVLYGSEKECDTAYTILTREIPEIATMQEREVRIAIQKVIDQFDIKADILCNGNTVWSLKRIVKDLKRCQKNGMDKMTNYLYSFLSGSCGSIAHYNKFGWIAEYPTFPQLKNFFRRNEMGQNIIVYSTYGRTYSDKERIAKAINETFKLGL